MKRVLAYFLILLCLLPVLAACQKPSSVALFDGESFAGWEGDTVDTWRIENGAIVGGTLTETVPHNMFLCTTDTYEDFVLTFQFKLEGTEGFVNAGVQFWSERLDDPAYEMIGYQADMGDGYYGALYDESRRRRILAAPDSVMIQKIVKIGAWNDYEIRAKGRRIQLFINHQPTVDYTEPDAGIPQSGRIGLQIHGDGKARVSYRNLVMTK